MNTAVNSLPIRIAPRATAGSVTGLALWFKHAANSVWRALEALGQARAQPGLLALADQCAALQPGLARELRAASRQGPMA